MKNDNTENSHSADAPEYNESSTDFIDEILARPPTHVRRLSEDGLSISDILALTEKKLSLKQLLDANLKLRIASRRKDPDAVDEEHERYRNLDFAHYKLREQAREALLLYEAIDGKSHDEAQLYLFNQPPSPGAILFLLDVAINSFKTLAVKQRLAAKAQKAMKAKQFVLNEWDKYKDEYKNNKSEFARIYARRVSNEYGRKVTERTIRESWLKGR